MPSSILSRILVAALLCTGALPGVAQNLLVTLSETPRAPGVISTRNTNDLALRVMSGSTVSLARATGRDYRLEAGGGFVWTQVQEVPQDSESVEITPLLSEDGSIEVKLHVARKNGTRMQRYDTAVIAQPGEWTQILGSPAGARRGTRTYGTASVSGDSLYLRVDP